MYDIPTGYSCITRSSDGNYLYGYNGNVRDQFSVNGFTWQKIATSTNINTPNNLVCLNNPQYPNNFFTPVIISSVIIVLCFFKIILNMFMGVRR